MFRFLKILVKSDYNKIEQLYGTLDSYISHDKLRTIVELLLHTNQINVLTSLEIKTQFSYCLSFEYRVN